jgi:hypothetical protein
MKDWHLEHAEKVIVRFARGLPASASQYEKNLYKKYGTVSSVIRQLEYDMHHGVQKDEIIQIIRKNGRSKKHSKVNSHPEAKMRLGELEKYLSGITDAKHFEWVEHIPKQKARIAEGL